MTLQQLEYVLAIAQQGSITKAAQVLYKAQPNISNALKELEDELGIKIFERVFNGVRLTMQGEDFLNQASALVEQAKRLVHTYAKTSQEEVQFRISIARSSYMMQGIAKWINHIDKEIPIQVHLIETNTNQVIDDIRNARSDLGIIRIPIDQQAFIDHLLAKKHIVQQTLSEFPMRIVFKKNHPLNQLEQITYEDLLPYTEIIHGDDRLQTLQHTHPSIEYHAHNKKRKVYVYDRGSQINLLELIDTAYMWVSPIPFDMLEAYQMSIREVSFSTIHQKDIIIYRKDSIQLSMIKACCSYVQAFASTLQASQNK